ncbi:hypothetical protein DFR69_1088 [Nocardia neocaledoniensis]|uniref:Uncharacterized protein n=1 Tax=Nocardia neocaledoniensis TaxID=236511 RepID=A0A317NCA5_9NOCA|nr:hypothetical protein DFR69_1088 [Nocardia neocaledoniensis]
MLDVGLFGVSDQTQSLTSVAEPSLDFGLNRIEPGSQLMVSVAPPCECSGRTNALPRFLGSLGYTGERRDKSHVRKHRTAQQGIGRFVGSLECENKTGLRLLGLLEVEELEAACEQRRF